MATAQPTGTQSKYSNALTSLWDGLNPFLLAKFWKCKKQGDVYVRDTSFPEVVFGMDDANLELALNWQSPFENSGTESQAPTVAAMLQTGSLQPLLTAVLGNEGIAGEARKKASDVVRQFEGRSGITKLNSMQVFNGMQPVKITGTLILRAWRDPSAEVEAPLAQLLDWIVPQELSSDGSVLARAANTASGSMSTVEALMPSLSPCIVALSYKGRLFKDMVIETGGIQLSAPIDNKGRFVQQRIPVTICSLTAWDREDFKNIAWKPGRI